MCLHIYAIFFRRIIRRGLKKGLLLVRMSRRGRCRYTSKGRCSCLTSWHWCCWRCLPRRRYNNICLCPHKFRGIQEEHNICMLLICERAVYRIVVRKQTIGTLLYRPTLTIWSEWNSEEVGCHSWSATIDHKAWLSRSGEDDGRSSHIGIWITCIINRVVSDGIGHNIAIEIIVMEECLQQNVL